MLLICIEWWSRWVLQFDICHRVIFNLDEPCQRINQQVGWCKIIWQSSPRLRITLWHISNWGSPPLDHHFGGIYGPSAAVWQKHFPLDPFNGVPWFLGEDIICNWLPGVWVWRGVVPMAALQQLAYMEVITGVGKLEQFPKECGCGYMQGHGLGS